MPSPEPMLYLTGRMVDGQIKDHSPIPHLDHAIEAPHVTEVFDPEFGWCFDLDRRWSTGLAPCIKVSLRHAIQAFTVAMWVRRPRNMLPGWNTLLRFGDATQFGFNNGRVACYSGQSAVEHAEAGELTPEWTHVALTYAGAGPGQTALYLGDTPALHSQIELGVEERLSVSTDSAGMGQTMFAGRVAHVMLFDHALTADELREVRQRTRGAPLADQTPVKLSEIVQQVEAELRTARTGAGGQARGFDFGTVSVELGFLPAGAGSAAYLPGPETLARIGSLPLSTLRFELEPVAATATRVATLPLPDLRGLSEHVARDRLIAASLKPEVKYQTVAEAAGTAGLVQAHVPAPGVEVAPGHAVMLVVARAEQVVEAAPVVAVEPIAEPPADDAHPPPQDGLGDSQPRLHFNGAVRIDAGFELPEDQYTIEFWCQLPAVRDGDMRLVGGRDEVRARSSGELRAYIDRHYLKHGQVDPDGIMMNDVSSPHYYDLNPWAHVAIIRSRSDQMRTITTRRAGGQRNQRSQWLSSLVRPAENPEEWDLRLGARNAVDWEDALIGYIDEIRIWSTIRTSSQLRAYDDKRLPDPESYGADELLAYWRTDETHVVHNHSVGLIPDLSRNDHTAQIVGPISFVNI